MRTRGRLLNLFRAMLHAPAVAEPWVHLGSALRYGTGLDDRTRELAITQVAARTGSVYEWHHHAPLAAAAGVGRAQLAALPDWDGDALVDPADRQLLDYVDRVLDGRVDDDTFGRVVERFGTRGAVELTATVAFYLCVSRFLSALDVEPEGERAGR